MRIRFEILLLSTSLAILSGCSPVPAEKGFSTPVPAEKGFSIPPDLVPKQPLQSQDGYNSSGSLLYVSNFKRKSVNFYSYPALKLVGEIPVTPYSVTGSCSDGAGNVWIVTESAGAGTLTEYAHGGTTPISTLPVPGTDAYLCTVDRSTGTLAVAYDGYDVAVYQNEQSSPQTFEDESVGGIHSMTYDTKGNLYIYGAPSGAQPVLGELANGGSAFSNQTFAKTMQRATFAQWHGNNILLGGITSIGRKTVTETVWAATISKSAIKVTHSQTFTVTGGTSIGQNALVQGKTLIQQDGNGKTIYFFNFPAGGQPIRSLQNSRSSTITTLTLSS